MGAKDCSAGAGIYLPGEELGTCVRTTGTVQHIEKGVMVCRAITAGDFSYMHISECINYISFFLEVFLRSQLIPPLYQYLSVT